MTVPGPAASPRPSLMTAAAGWLLVAAQLALAGVLIGELRRVRRRRLWRRCAGGVLVLGGVAMMGAAAAQLGRSLHPHPTPPAAAVLRTSGLYRHVRHPLYTGFLLWAGGAAVIGGSARALAAFVALAAVLGVKAPYEERELARRFSEYPEYARRTPRFLPRLPSRLRSSIVAGEPTA